MPAQAANSKLTFLDLLRTSPSLDHPIITGLIMGPAVWFSVLLSNHTEHFSAIWVANAIIFMWLLPVPPRRLPWHILCAGGAYASADWYWHFPIATILLITLSSMAKICLLLAFTRRYYDAPARHFRITALRFTLLTIAVVDSVYLVMAPFLYASLGPRLYITLVNWSMSDILGTLLVVALVGFWRRRAYSCAFHRQAIEGTLVCIGIVLATTWFVFEQSSYPLLFLPFSILIYVLFKRGIAVAILCLALHAVIAPLLTIHGHGPMLLMPHTTPLIQIVALQVYLFILLSTIYPVGVSLHAQRKLQSLYSLLADNSGDVITRASLNGVRHYCSPSVTRVLGWTPAEMTDVAASTLYHPDDAPHFEDVFRRMRAGEIAASVLPYRARTKAGPYLWMEAHIRVLLDPVTGSPTGFIANSRDISERVAAEANLQAAHRDLQRLASTDPLTSLANRRTFDESLEREWRRAKRERTPLAVFMMDVDFFKKYNDALGHPAGDECLRRVARCLSEVVQRPSDLVARYGGEEFVALLPFTEAVGAQQLAQRVKDALSRLALPHPATPTTTVTLSIGVASIFPSLGYSPTAVVAAADRALYTAKKTGRNRIEISQPERDPLPGRADWEHPQPESAEILADAADVA